MKKNLENSFLPQQHFTASKNSSSSMANLPNNIADNRTGKTAPNSITPPINGEAFDIKRTYPFRKSTIRKLNELKAAHADVSVYLSTILNEAITEDYEVTLLTL